MLVVSNIKQITESATDVLHSATVDFTTAQFSQIGNDKTAHKLLDIFEDLCGLSHYVVLLGGGLAPAVILGLVNVPGCIIRVDAMRQSTFKMEGNQVSHYMHQCAVCSRTQSVIKE